MVDSVYAELYAEVPRQVAGAIDAAAGRDEAAYTAGPRRAYGGTSRSDASEGASEDRP
jgi:hypothetical protein